MSDHYKQGDIECIDAIRSALTPCEFQGFCKGNVMKYVWRERHKGQLEDLDKALDYMGWLIESVRHEGEEDDNGLHDPAGR